jgi:hypothetical protein
MLNTTVTPHRKETKYEGSFAFIAILHIESVGPALKTKLMTE